MCFEAHLNDDTTSAQEIQMFCPKCGKKRGEYHKHTPLKLKGSELHPTERQCTRQCNACQHSWFEFGDVQ